MRPHTHDRGRGGARRRARLAGRLPRHPRSPPRVRRRRVLPARRPSVPRARAPTRASRCTRTASAWPAPSSSSSPGRVEPGDRGPAGFFAWVDGAPAEGYRAPRLADPRPGARRPAARRPPRRSGILTGPLRRRRARAPGRPRCGRPDVRVIAVANEFFGGNIGVTGLMVGADVARVLADEPEGHRYLLPDVCLSQGRFLDGVHAGGPAPAGRDRDHRRHRAPRRPGTDRSPDVTHRPAQPASDEAPHRRRRRSPQRRQVDPLQPHRRAPRGDRRGEAGRHPRPQGGRGRVAGPPVPAGRHRRLAARWRRPRRQGQSPERAGHRGGRRGAVRRRRHRRHHRGGQPGRRPAAAATAPVLLVTNKVDDTNREAAIWEFVSPRPGRPVPGERAARSRHGRPARGARRRPAPVVPEAAAPPAMAAGVSTAGVMASPRMRPARAAEPPTASGSSRSRIVGRPNVGKSTLFNRLIGDDRSVVHDMPGTTRDAVDTVVETAGRAGALRRHRRHAPQGRRSTRAPSTTRSSGPCRPSTAPMSPCSSSTPRSASPTRTSASPSGSTPPAARSWCCSTSGRLLDAEERLDDHRTRSASGSTSSATSPVLKISALTGKGVHRCCRRSPTRSTTTTGGCPPGRSTR